MLSLSPRRCDCWCWVALPPLLVLLVIISNNGVIGSVGAVEGGMPRRILVDTDVDTDDFFALLYLSKLNTSLFQLEVS